jgi:DNA-binding SARP family transcriptional activator
VTVRLLGGFRIHTHAENDEVGHGLRDETREFLALLAAHPRGVRTEEIPDHLRMTADPDQAARELGNMRRAVRRILRGATGARQAAFIVRTGDRTRLDPTLVATDVEAFTTAIHQAAAATTDTAARAAALRTAVGTYAGPLCEGADYPWADALREALHRKAVDALVLLADHTATHHPEPDPALALLDHATDWDPYNEPVYQRIIRLQLATGRDDAARRTYHHLTRRLTEIDATPDPATTALLRQAVSGFFRE